METSEAIEMLKKGELCPDCGGYLKPNIPYCPACGYSLKGKKNPLISLIGFGVPIAFITVYILEYFIPSLNLVTPVIKRVAYSALDTFSGMQSSGISMVQAEILVVLLGAAFFTFGSFFLIVMMKKI